MIYSFPWNQLVRFLRSPRCIEKIALGLFLLGDVRHDRHCTTCRHPTAQYAIPPAVGGVVLKANPLGIAQTLHALGDERVDVTLAVVTVLSQIAQKIGIGSAGLQQLLLGTVYISLKRLLQTTILKLSSV